MANQAHNIELSRHVRDVVLKRQPVIWAPGTWYICHDNVQVHITLSIQELLAKYYFPVPPEPPLVS
jgi:hypothetical protein